MIRITPVLLLLLISSLTAFGQTKPATADTTFSKWQVGINGGLARRLFRTRVINDEATYNYVEKLRDGLSFGADVTYFVWPKVGFGLVYDRFFNNATSADSLTEKVTIQHLSASITYRSFLKNNKTSVNTSFLTGYQPYQNKTSFAGQDLTFNGKTMGWGIRVSLDHKVAPKLAISLAGTAMMGGIFRLERKTELSTHTLRLSKDDYVDLSRAWITLGLKFL